MSSLTKKRSCAYYSTYKYNEQVLQGITGKKYRLYRSYPQKGGGIDEGDMTDYNCENCGGEAKVLRKKLGIKGWVCELCFRERAVERPQSPEIRPNSRVQGEKA